MTFKSGWPVSFPAVQKASFWLLVLMLLAVGCLLAVHAHLSYREFNASQTKLAQQSVAGAATLIADYMNVLNFRIMLFSDAEQAALARLAADPDDVDAWNRVQTRIAQYFKYAFAFSVADEKGEILVQDFNGKIEEVCKADLRNYALHPDSRATYIHPNPLGYHFDIVRSLKLGENRRGLFFLSFYPQRIATILKGSEIAGHRLLLLNSDRPGLIEITAQGSREALGENTWLGPGKLEQALAQSKVPGSKWLLADLPERGWMEQERSRLVSQAILGFVVFFIMAATLYSLVRRQEVKLHKVRKALAEANASLEGRVLERTRVLREMNRELLRQSQAREEAMRSLQVTNMELARAQGRIRQVIDSSLVAHLLVDERGQIVLANAAAERLFGYGHDELVGNSVEALIPADKCEAHVRHRHDYAEHPYIGIMTGRRVTAQRKNGRVFPAEVGLNPLDMPEGSMVLAEVKDISERENFEQALLERNQALERSNRELQEFAYVASHDLQEPLRKIQAFGDLLEKTLGDRLDERGADYLGRLRGAAGRMSKLIEDLLAYSRVATRNQPFEMVDMNRVVTGVLDDLEVRIRENQATIDIGDLPVIMADETQMRQLFQNLIGNALKYRKPHTPPSIHIRAEEDDNDFWRIEVSDNGIGFEEQYAERIFGVFERLHTREHYEGTGVGLAVCRRIAERHNGRITATSRQGEGSTFTVILPALQRETLGEQNS
jgi:two-component system, LuxR family, sensor kinase FixL